MSDTTPPQTAYRASSCETCASRDKARKTIHPFIPHTQAKCPACKSRSVKMWGIICNGSLALLVKKGFWLFRWWGRESFPCRHAQSRPVPSHLHLECDACSYRWEMLTALETVDGHAKDA